MGGTGDSPVPVGDPADRNGLTPTSREAANRESRPIPVPSGESPDGTGQWPVPPKSEFENTPWGIFIKTLAGARRSRRFSVALPIHVEAG
jgi:hypothetical protein